jgi:hypothetical protein
VREGCNRSKQGLFGAPKCVTRISPKTLHTTDPIWEFLRHCRNAAAHKGRFNLVRGEPRRLATWRSKTTAPGLNGTLLFTDGKLPGFLGPGDVLYLLSDLEKAR